MAGNVSPKDMEIISRGVLDGYEQMDNLPPTVRRKLLEYWEPMGIDPNQPDSEMTRQQIEALKEQREAQRGGVFDLPIFKPIEWVGAKLYQAWSETVSPAASFAALNLSTSLESLKSGEIDDKALGFKDSWELAHHVSPGQAWWMLGMSPEGRERSGLSHDQLLKDELAYERGDYKDEKTLSDPLGFKTRKQEYFGTGPSKWATGAVDFSLSWYADPLVIAGKGAGAAKTKFVTTPVTPAILKEEQAALKAQPGLSAEEANKVAWDSFSQKSQFEGLVDEIWNVKQANPDTAASVLNRNLPTLRKSANGPAAAKLLAQATDKSEVANVLRVSMGDEFAKTTLEFQNSRLSYQINELNSRVSSIDSYYQGLPAAQQASPFGQRVKALMDSKSQEIARLDRDSRIITDKIDAFAKIGSLNYNRITTPAGAKLRNAYQSSRKWKPFDQGGVFKSPVNLAYSLSLGGVVKLAHSYNDIKPTHYIDVKDPDGWRQLDASLLEVRGLSQEAREMYVSRYLEADEGMRAATLSQIETAVAKNMVDRYNLKNGLTGTPDEISYTVAESLYKEVASRRSSAQAGVRSEMYGTAHVPNPYDPTGSPLRVDMISPDGGKLVVAPLLRSQMANSHSIIDFKLFDKALKANASTWQKALNQIGPGWESAVGLADYVGSLWKFSQLFRLGYGPRALADDTLGQVARFGFADMVSRAVKGGKYNLETLRRAAMPDGALEASRISREHLALDIEDLTLKQAKLSEKIATARIEGRTADVQKLTDDLNTNLDIMAELRTAFADMDALVKGGAAMKHEKIGRQIFDPSFAGAEGALFRDLASGEKNFGNMMGSSADRLLNRYRQMDWEQISVAQHGADAHMSAWLNVLNKQVANDELARLYLKGKTPDELERWLSTPAGLAYKRDHRIAQSLPHDQLVERVTVQLDEWLNPALPGVDAVKLATLEGKVTKGMLEGVPEVARPMVNGQSLSYARGSHEVMHSIDRFMNGWYNIAAQMPQRYLLRNPLFAQRYKVHLNDIMSAAGRSGTTRMTEATRQQFESAARKRALRDVKQNTFTMDYETRMSHALRNFGAFFGAQQESWNRWARIISDKPDILARVPQVYGAPARAGIMTDGQGHRISEDGYVTDPDTGERRLVDYSDRHTVIQIPDYLGGKAFKKAFGLDPNATFDIPMSTAEIILNHGDGPIPVGAGPYVQMAANNLPFTGLDANGDPKIADFYKHLGILPFGATESNLETFLPNWARKAAGAGELTETYQGNLWYIMQAEDYKYREGLRKTKPSWEEITDRATKQTWMKALFAATLPVSMQAKDPYDFFRHQYRQMQAADPENADQKFYDKYGDSAYTFAQSMSKNNSGLKPTAEAVYASKYYQDLISKVGPEWAGLIVGAEGEGAYSEGAFFYQRNNPVDPASGATARTKMSARESLEQSDLARGWRQYKGYMNDLYAQLFSRGLKTFQDEGAEDLLAEKKALVEVLSSPRVIGEDGEMQDNPNYNAAWSKAYNSFDLNYYDRATQSLRQIVDDPEVWAKAVNPQGSTGMRSDIYTLKTYLSYRDDLKRALLMRGETEEGSADINAETNADLKGQWNALVITLIERDTKFGDLHNRYLSRDMGFDEDTVIQERQLGELEAFQGNVEEAQEQSIFDVLAEQGVF